MTEIVQQRRPLEELAYLGEQIFKKTIQPNVRPDDESKFLAIDVLTGEYEIDEDDYSAMNRLSDRNPNADIWIMRADGTPAYRMRFLK